ncbi:MAG: DNA mismatch repair endonuclease MutL, partial [Robiginitalea sp.]
MAEHIELLPEYVANQIAAGEVVQRPASVVKELLENAIDSGAGQIKLIVKEGGKTLIQVVDDGMGMGPGDARMSIQRHATSKIRKAEDLFHIHTKGFRGEALASIAAIAQLELTTRDAENSLGTYLRISGGRDITVEEIVTAEGTSVSVKNLFFNIPARRNFLKSAKVEYRHVLEEFQRVALAHPNIEFSLFHNDSELFKLPASNLRKRIVHLFGNRINSRLVPVAEETQVVQIGGFILKPEFAKKSRGEQFFFVNERFIKSPYLHHAVMNAYEGLLKQDTLPGYFIFLQVPPESIDINIHPTKTEIKFEDEHTLYAILRSAIKHSLGQFNIRPVLDFDSDQNLETPYNYKDREAVVPKVAVDREFNPFQGDTASRTQRQSFKQRSAKGWELLYEGLQDQPGSVKEADAWIVESEAREESLFESDTLESLTEVLSFQIDRKYILTRIRSGVLLIDQQRAHQRVLYEKLLQNLSRNEPVSQTLLFPVKLEFGAGALQVIHEMQDALIVLGFGYKLTESGIEIDSMPAIFPASIAAQVFDELISRWQHHEGTLQFSDGDRLARLLSQSLAIRPGKVLDANSRHALINDLFACKEIARCPFNKKIHVTLSVDELE